MCGATQESLLCSVAKKTAQCEQSGTTGPFYSLLIDNYFSKSTLCDRVATIQCHSGGFGRVAACEHHSKYVPLAKMEVGYPRGKGRKNTGFLCPRTCLAEVGSQDNGTWNHTGFLCFMAEAPGSQ